MFYCASNLEDQNCSLEMQTYLFYAKSSLGIIHMQKKTEGLMPDCQCNY